MEKYIVFACVCVLLMTGCGKSSKLDQWRAEKHVRDSVALVEQERSMDYYLTQLDSLQPVVDELLTHFKYEKNEKYQDHGFYVTTGSTGVRIMVRDDGHSPILAYYNGEKLMINGDKIGGKGYHMTDADARALEYAQHLAVVMADIIELELRVQRTSQEIQKYQKRLQKQVVQ